MSVFWKMSFMSVGRHHNDPKLILICQKWAQSKLKAIPKSFTAALKCQKWDPSGPKVESKSPQSEPRMTSKAHKVAQGHPHMP